jgi:hypothetical protein
MRGEEELSVKKRFVTAAAGTALVLATAIPAGSAFAVRHPHTLSPTGKAVKCATLASQITNLNTRAAATSDPVTQSFLAGLAAQLNAKYVALCI